LIHAHSEHVSGMGSKMNTQKGRTHRFATAGLLAGACVAALLPSVIASPARVSVTVADGACINGVYPLNPYVVNCNLPPRSKRVIGSAPDAGALIACRDNPWCLSYYVNYPGALLVPGYHP
jgi:hypothetical protein